MTNTYNKDLNILFWNARSISKRKEELPKILSTIDIFVCVETWLTNDHDSFQIPGFTTIRKDRSQGKGGGIMFLTRKSLDIVELKLNNSANNTVEICGIRVENISPQLNIVACYRPPNNNLSAEEWDNIVNHVKNSHSILLGDFNAHHQTWNCASNDTNGNRFLNSIDKNDLFIHNTKSNSRIDFNLGTKSNIDLVLSTMDLVDKITTTAYDETHGSDHLPILTILSTTKNSYEKKNFKIKSTRTNWGGFLKTLTDNFSKFLESKYNNSLPSAKYQIFTTEVSSAIIANTPKKQNKNTLNKNKHKNPVIWWDPECDRVLRLRKAALKKWEYSKKLDDYIGYKKQVAIAKKTLKQKKKESFNAFAQSLNFHTNCSHVWNTAKIFKNRWANITPTTCMIPNKKEKLDLALDKLSPSWVPTNPDWLPQCIQNTFLSKHFEFSEFNIALD